MKNQGIWITKILSLALCGFIILYMGYHLISLWNDPIKTTTAVLFTTSHSQQTEGVIVRDEHIFPMPTGLIELRAEEAERVSRGQALAVSYASASAMQDSQTLAQCLEQRELLAYIETHSSGALEPALLDEKIRSGISSVLASLDTGTPSDIAARCTELKALLFRQSYSFGGEAELAPIIARLDAEISRLSGSVSSVTTTLSADSSGLFSARTDGLESVWTPGAVKDITPSEFTGLSARQGNLATGGDARLVTDWTWRYVCVMPSASAYAIASSAEVRFEGGGSYVLEREYVSPAEDGMCAVTFCSPKYISSLINVRRIRADVVFSDYTGVRIPREGLRIDTEGRRYVYCLVLGAVVRKNVTVYDDIDRENYYLAPYDPTNTSSLLPGDEIIISGRDLYDGKVLRK